MDPDLPTFTEAFTAICFGLGLLFIFVMVVLFLYHDLLDARYVRRRKGTRDL